MQQSTPAITPNLQTVPRVQARSDHTGLPTLQLRSSCRGRLSLAQGWSKWHMATKLSWKEPLIDSYIAIDIAMIYIYIYIF